MTNTTTDDSAAIVANYDAPFAAFVDAVVACTTIAVLAVGAAIVVCDAVAFAASLSLSIYIYISLKQQRFDGIII